MSRVVVVDDDYRDSASVEAHLNLGCKADSRPAVDQANLAVDLGGVAQWTSALGCTRGFDARDGPRVHGVSVCIASGRQTTSTNVRARGSVDRKILGANSATANCVGSDVRVENVTGLIIKGRGHAERSAGCGRAAVDVIRIARIARGRTNDDAGRSSI